MPSISLTCLKTLLKYNKQSIVSLNLGTVPSHLVPRVAHPCLSSTQIKYKQKVDNLI